MPYYQANDLFSMLLEKTGFLLLLLIDVYISSIGELSENRLSDTPALRALLGLMRCAPRTLRLLKHIQRDFYTIFYLLQEISRKFPDLMD